MLKLSPGKIVFLVNVMMIAALWLGDLWNNRQESKHNTDESLGYACVAVFIIVMLVVIDLTYGMWRVFVWLADLG